MIQPTHDDRVARFLLNGGYPSEIWFSRLNGSPRRAGWRVVPRLMSAPAVFGDIVRELARGEIGKARRMFVTIRQIPREPACMISRRYRFVWIANEKSGSRSLIAALFGVDPGAEWVLNTSIADICARYPETKDYFSFAFVRHPFDKAISFHSDLHGYRRNFNETFRARKNEINRFFFTRYHGLAETRDFDAYCEWLNSPYGSDEYAARIFRSQHLVIRMGRDRLPDFVGRLENIRADLDHVASRVGMPKPALPTLNTMSGWRTTPEALRAARSKAAVQLTDRNKALLRKRYQGDFLLGGYS